MKNRIPHDPRQETILQILATPENSGLVELYFRIKTIAGKKDISLSDMLMTLQIPCMMQGNQVVYRQGERADVHGVDQQLNRAFLNYKANALQFSAAETAALLHCGADPNSVYRAAIVNC